jgi:hypothetical protein
MVIYSDTHTAATDTEKRVALYAIPSWCPVVFQLYNVYCCVRFFSEKISHQNYEQTEQPLQNSHTVLLMRKENIIMFALQVFVILGAVVGVVSCTTGCSEHEKVEVLEACKRIQAEQKYLKHAAREDQVNFDLFLIKQIWLQKCDFLHAALDRSFQTFERALTDQIKIAIHSGQLIDFVLESSDIPDFLNATAFSTLPEDIRSSQTMIATLSSGAQSMLAVVKICPTCVDSLRQALIMVQSKEAADIMAAVMSYEAANFAKTALTLEASSQALSTIITHSDKVLTNVAPWMPVIIVASNAGDAIQQYWNGKISGERAVTNILSAMGGAVGGVAMGYAGGAAGALVCSPLGPVGAAVCSSAGVAISQYYFYGVASDITRQWLLKYFNLPPTEALEEAFKALGVDHKSSNNAINTAYYKLAKQYHPDKNGGNATKMEQLNVHMALICASRNVVLQEESNGCNFDPSKRTDMGFIGITKEQCLQKSYACYDASKPSYPNCYERIDKAQLRFKDQLLKYMSAMKRELDECMTTTTGSGLHRDREFQDVYQHIIWELEKLDTQPEYDSSSVAYRRTMARTMFDRRPKCAASASSSMKDHHLL